MPVDETNNYNMKLLIEIIIFLLPTSILGQHLSLDVETERFKSASQVDIISYNWSGESEYNSIYFFDTSGRAIESKIFIESRLFEQEKYYYKEKDLLSMIVHTDDQFKDIIDTTFFKYETDSNGNITSKITLLNNKNSTTVSYKDFDSTGLPLTEILERNYIRKLKYDKLGRIIMSQTIGPREIIIEENRYNENGDVVYFHLVSYDPFDYANGNYECANFLFSPTQEFEFAYDDYKRWIECYAISKDRKILIKKRIFKNKESK